MKEYMLLGEKFDLRTLEFALSNGLINQKEYQKFLAELPDFENNVEYIEFEINEFEEDEIEEQEDELVSA
ncbi:MAG: hypothetical protein H7A32_05320 [Deltaproteobacteria bacterium]|nr:hypothetical protein [Deltaproteobacteria bacterium]